jgi:hypothetical protein
MDVRALDRLAQNVGRLARVPSRIASTAAPAIAALIDQGFAAGRDPYGQAWAKLRPSTVARGRRPPPLTDTGTMRRGVSVRPMAGAGIAVSFASDIPSIFHQYGTRKMAARPMLPRGAFPATWARAIERIGETEFRKSSEAR